MGLVLTSSGFLDVPGPNFSTIYVFSVSSGTLTAVGQPILVNGGLGGIVVGSGAKFLYATNPSTATVSGFSIQSGGSLMALPGLTASTKSIPVAAGAAMPRMFPLVPYASTRTLCQCAIN